MLMSDLDLQRQRNSICAAIRLTRLSDYCQKIIRSTVSRNKYQYVSFLEGLELTIGMFV